MVRRLNLPGSVQTEPLESTKTPGVRPFNLPKAGSVELNAPVPKSVKKFNLPPAGSTPQVVSAPRPKSQIDILIDAVVDIDTTIEPMRVRARLQSLLATGINGLLDWGESSLSPLQAATSLQSQIASRMAQINPSGWINDTLEASSKRPSFMDLLAKKPGPDYYEGMIRKCRAELMVLVKEINTIGTNYEPKVRDLQLDAITMLVVANSNPYDDANNMVAANRARSLQQAHQTASMLLETIKLTKLQIADYVQKIDDVINVTLTNWKMADSNK